MFWAEINENRVTRVTVSETEEFGAEWLMANVGGVWVAVPTDMPVSPGYEYEVDLHRFIPPKPFASWVLNESDLVWEAPIPMPDDNQVYFWDEELGDWVWDEQAGEWIEVTNV